MNKAEALKSITNDEERILYARAIDKAMMTLKCYEPQFSDFMDPFKMNTLCQIINKQFALNLNTLVWGGFADAERRIIGFYPDYDEPNTNNFPISCVEISYNAKFSRELTHRDYLGSILGLGIKREKVGDIILNNDSAYVFAEADVADFICTNLERVGHTKVKAKIIDNYNVFTTPSEEKRITVASLRLDAVLCGAFNMSRGKVADLIKGEKAFINWIPVTSGAKTVDEGDMLTLRGTGRVLVKSIQGVTKKERVALVLEIHK